MGSSLALLGGTACAQSVGATYGDSPKVSTKLEGNYKLESGKVVDYKYAVGPRLRDILKLEEAWRTVPEERLGPGLFYDEDRSERDMQLKIKRKKTN